MVNLRLVHYIEKELDKNFKRDRIKTVLVKYGYKESEVDGAFQYLNEKKEGKHIEQISSDEIIAKALPHKERHLGLVMIALALLIIGSFVIFKGVMNQDPDGPLIEFNGSDKPVPIDYSKFNLGSTYEALTIECMEEYFAETEYDDICNAIALDDKDECEEADCDSYYGIIKAIERNSKPACQGIKDSDMRQFCHQILDSDDSKCSFRETTEEQNECKALITANEALCPDDECRQNIILMSAVRQKNKIMCRTLSDLSNKNRCLAVISKDVNDCINKEECADDAWFNVALLSHNESYCMNIFDEQYKVECANMISNSVY